MIDISKKRWHVFSIVTIVGFIIDWTSKYLVSHSFPYAKAKPVLGHWLEFLFVYNTGALFSLNPKMLLPNFPTSIFLTFFSICATIFVIWFYKNTDSSQKLSLWGLAFVMPGALGNFFDRLFNSSKGVIDFIKVDLGFPPFDPWPIFNIADIWISVGVGLILLDIIFNGNKNSTSERNSDV